MRRTKLSTRTSVVVSAGAMTLHQEGFEGLKDNTITLNLDAAAALLPTLTKFVAGHSGFKARSRSDSSLASSPAAKREAKAKPKGAGKR